MGTTLNKRGADYGIQVITGDKRGAGTDASVRCALINSEGQRSRDLTLDVPLKNDFERGQTDCFYIRKLPDFGPIGEIELWRDSVGLFSDWYVQCITVTWLTAPSNEKSEFIFPVNRWISARDHHFFSEYDFCLPQDEKHPEARAHELAEKRRLYEFNIVVEGLPPMLKELPHEEALPSDYDFELQKSKYSWMLQSKLTEIFTRKIKKLDEMDDLFKFSFGVPKAKEFWMTDEHFGRQRVQHSAPVLIRLCTKIPDNFAVTSEMVSTFLEDQSLEEALEKKRIFITDLTFLENIEGLNGRKCCAPLALFYVRNDKQLIPVAIQLMPTPAEDNPVFVPSDPKYTWILAKLFYNEAEGQYHQTCVHLGFTHFLMGAAIISVHRQLSPSHPVYRFLGPHMIYLLAVNDTGAKKLVNVGGWIDRTQKLGRDGGFRLLQKLNPHWRMNVDGNLPASLKEREVDDVEILPNYPYRDDALKVYDVIKKYVTTVIEAVYDEPSKLENDFELQAWAKELVTPAAEGGAGFLIEAVPGGGHFSNTQELIDVLTVIVFTCTVQHAAINFGQYDDYAFAPNYPNWLTQERPKDKEARTEEDVVAALPDKHTWLENILITRILSIKTDKRLGDFEESYLYHPIGTKAHEVFVADLQEVEEKINKRNADTQFPYTHVLPSQIPNAISI